MTTSINRKLLSIITEKRPYETQFAKSVASFKRKLEKFDPQKNAFDVGDYFKKGNGFARIKKALIADGLVKDDWIREYTTKEGKVKKDFSGLYVFLHKDTPIYVGISKGVIGRIQQHLKGHSHHTSTLAYNIALIRYRILKKEEYTGGRKHFDFKTHVGPAKEFLKQQRVAFLPISDATELYLFEIYCAMHFQCMLNRFETH